MTDTPIDPVVLAQYLRLPENEKALIFDVISRLTKARAKFPAQSVWVTLAALTEEVGELNKAVLEYNHEPHKQVEPIHIYDEGVDTIVMAIRVVLDCKLEDKG